MARTVCIAFGLGCTRAKVDTAQLFEYFKLNGWTATGSLETADLVVVNSCGFDSAWEDTSFRLLRSADRRRAAGSKLVITGCLAAIHGERLRRTFDAAVVPPLEKGLLDREVGAIIPLAAVPDPNRIDSDIARATACFDGRERFGRLGGFLVNSGLRDTLVRVGWKRPQEDLGTGRDSYTVRVAWGCRGECTYCTIPSACSGELRSKPLDAVRAEFEAGLARGHTDIKLLAPDLGAWGQDLNSSIVDLLRVLLERGDGFQLSLVDFNARWVVKHRDDLVEILSRDGQKIRELAMPVQSGSDRILRRMGRGHTAAEASQAFAALRAATAPGTVLATHAMIGFPGETEEDFQSTLELLRTARFDRVDVFEYSDRPGTLASTMPDKVGAGAIRSRSRRLRQEFGGGMAGVEYAVRCFLTPARV